MILDVGDFTDDRPFLLVDVDGVLNAINESQNRKTYDIFQSGPYRIRLRHELSGWLHRLSEHFELVWTTMWDEAANAELSPRLGLPNLPYIPCWENSGTPVLWNEHSLYSKVVGINEHLKDRPFAWIDDEIRDGEQEWARIRDDEVAPTCLLRIDAHMGLAEHHVDRLIEWAQLIK